MINPEKVNPESATEVAKAFREVVKSIDNLAQVMENSGTTINEKDAIDWKAYQDACVTVARLSGKNSDFILGAILPLVRSYSIRTASKIEEKHKTLQVQVTDQSKVDTGVAL